MYKQDFELLGSQIDRLAQMRTASSGDIYAQGVELLQQARKQQFRDKTRVLAATDSFIKAIRLNRQDPRPHLGMGYIFLLLNSPSKANVYLKQVLTLEPEQPDALRLLALSQSELSQPPKAGLVSAADADSSDYDQQEEQIQRQLTAALKKWLQMPPPVWTAETDNETLKQWELAARELAHMKSRLLAQLNELDQALDTEAQRAQMRPLEQLLRRYQQALHGARLLQTLGQDIATEVIKIKQSLKIIQTPPCDHALHSQALEAYMDSCDALADRIDELEAQGLPITNALQNYRLFKHLIESYRDQLDELED